MQDEQSNIPTPPNPPPPDTPVTPSTPGAPAPGTPGMSFQRTGDRRKRPTPFLSKYTFRGRRRASRRGDEKYNYYVDRIGSRVWGAIAVIIILSVIDSIFTLFFIHKGYREVNPVMNVAIFIGKPIFIVSKYIFTILGILVLGLHKNFRFVKELIALMVTFYLVLNSYHIWLFLHR